MTSTIDRDATTTPPAPEAPDAPQHSFATLAAVVGGLVAAVSLMLFAFAAPMLHSGPHDLPLAVSGPERATTQITGALEQKQPGAFDVTTYPSADEVRDAIDHREAIGGITAGPDGVHVITASGAGTPYSQVLKGIGGGLEAGGQHVTYEDVAPPTADDPTMSGIAALGLPLLFGGMAATVILVQLFKGKMSFRLLGSVTFSILAGLVAATILQFGFGAVDGNFWVTALGVTLGISAISLTILGMESLIGYAGLGIVALLMLFVANPLSGLATGPQWLPHPWGALGQLLPIGAAGTVIRSGAFFDGHGMTHAVVVLCCWIAFGIALTVIAGMRRRRARA